MSTFRLDPRAHFSDGAPITADDVVFTFDLLQTKGRPQQRAAYALVKASTRRTTQPSASISPASTTAKCR